MPVRQFFPGSSFRRILLAPALGEGEAKGAQAGESLPGKAPCHHCHRQGHDGAIRPERDPKRIPNRDGTRLRPIPRLIPPDPPTAVRGRQKASRCHGTAQRPSC